MYVLGIGGLGYKDSAAALLEDGRPVAAVHCAYRKRYHY